MSRLVLIAVLLQAPCFALSPAYSVETPAPESHLFHVELAVTEVAATALEFAMPAWTPGYYKIENHAKNVRDFEAKNAAGEALAWRKTDKQTWRVETKGSKDVRVNYRVYAHSLTAIGSDLTDEHAYFHGSWIFMYVVGAKLEPCTLRLNPRSGWKVATGLERGGGENEFKAPDYDVLIDCPVLMADFEDRVFEAGGAQHHVVIHGSPACDRAAMTEDIRKIVVAQLQIMGKPPYTDYWFLLFFPRWSSGGLEHLNSTSIVTNGEELGDRNRYLRFLFIVSHEFYHLWNVKRIRPEQLGPFDYTKEVPTKNLWVHEGFTTYYGWLAMQRAGIIDRKAYVGYLEEEVRGLLNRDGRKITSPEASSWDTWLDAHDRDSVEVSYYTTGHLLGLLLDLEIRNATTGASSLDGVMRLAYEKTAGPGYSADDWLTFVNQASGGDWSDFFRRHVSGTEEFPYARVLAYAGLKYEVKDEGPEADAGFDAHGIGEDLVRVSRVREKSLAAEAGLMDGDILLSSEGKRLRAGMFWGWLRGKKSGDKVTFVLFRGERTIEKTVTLGERRKITHIVQLIEKPSDGQKTILNGWLK